MNDPRIAALIKIAGELIRFNGMPPDDPDDWQFHESTGAKDRAKCIGYAKQARNQCRLIAIEIKAIAESLRCKVCGGAGKTDGALGFNGIGPCPKCQQEKTWGAYDLMVSPQTPPLTPPPSNFFRDSDDFSCDRRTAR